MQGEQRRLRRTCNDIYIRKGSKRDSYYGILLHHIPSKTLGNSRQSLYYSNGLFNCTEWKLNGATRRQ